MSDTTYLFIETLRDAWRSGGPVMLPILLSGAAGFFFLISAWLRVGIVSRHSPKILEKMHRALEQGNRREARNIVRKNSDFVAKEFRFALDKSIGSSKELDNYLTERLLRTDQHLEKGTRLISIMSATAPLLGLLGTVTGMVSTFDTITLYGNTNPLLLADGISEALITTQSGLLIAFPLTLLKQQLDDRLEYVKQQIELGFTFISHYRQEEDSYEL